MKGHAIQVLLTTRSVDQLPFSQEGWWNVLSLSGLPNVECLSLIDALDIDHRLSDSIRCEIINKSGGVPFFIEETVKSSLLKGGKLESIPPTLMGALAMRLDMMGSLKYLVQALSVIGMEFSVSLVEQLADFERDIHASLGKLIELGILQRKTNSDKAVVLEFSSGLMKDAAYQSLLLKKRKHLHQKVAKILTEVKASVYPPAIPEVIAYHFQQGGLPERAIDFWIDAAKRATQIYAYSDASRYYELALDCLKGIDRKDKEDLRLNLLIARGTNLMLKSGFASREVGETFSQAYELCQKTKRVLPEVLYGLAVYLLTRGQYRKCSIIADRMIASSSRISDEEVAATGHRLMALSSLCLGVLTEAKEHYYLLKVNDSPQFRKEVSIRFGGVDPYSSSIIFEAMVDWLEGRDPKESMQQALLEAGAFVSPSNHVYVLSVSCLIGMLQGDVDGVRKRAVKAMELAEKHSFQLYLGWHQIMLGWAKCTSDSLGQGLRMMQKGIEFCNRTGALLFMPYWLAVFADILLSAGASENARKILDKSIHLASTHEEKWCGTYLSLVRGKIICEMEGREAATKVWSEALEAAKTGKCIGFNAMLEKVLAES
ncbi:MAG: hypothetical protein D6694_02885 [Gammaproteobacteria bacterium]|nr:MAG: hypothetical protein D6694_02885 [Gammaproteobacteria bacterium]